MMNQLLEIDLLLTQALNGSSSLFVDGLAMTATATLTWLPLAVAFLFMLVRTHSVRDVAVILLATALCVLLADQIASGIFKPLVARYRPARDPSLMHLIDVVDGYRGGRYGFFSSHASNTFALATFASLLVRSRSFMVCIYAWAVVNCWTRIYLGVHYVGDILAGVLCGLVVGSLVYLLLRKCLERTHAYSNVEIQTKSGYTYADISGFIAIFLLTILYCIVRSLVYAS